MAKRKYKVEWTIGSMPTNSSTVSTLGEIRTLVDIWLKHAEHAEHGCVINISNEYASQWQDVNKLAAAYDIDLCQDKDMILEDIDYAITCSEDIKRTEDLVRIKKHVLEN